MDETTLASAMAALGHPLRLKAVRELARKPDGVTAGELARRLVVRQNTLSSHIATLERRGLVYGHRNGRYIIYRLDAVTMKAVLRSAKLLSAGE